MKPALIYASGSARRWARCGEGNAISMHKMKQLLPIEGTPVICRTIQQCLDRHVRPVVITPHQPIKDAVNDAFTDFCISHTVDFLDVGSPYLLVETIAASLPAIRPHEQNGTIIGLLGDCFYSEWCMDQITASDDLRFFGRMDGSVITGGCGELFAWTWNHGKNWLQQAHAIQMAIEEAAADPETRNQAGTPYGGLWQLYRGSVGIPLDVHDCEHHFQTIYDFTDDFDTPEDYARWTERYSRRMIKQGKGDNGN